MASDAEVQQLRLLVAEPTNALPYTDAALSTAIDNAEGDLNLAAYNIWTQKAAAAADLVDVTEGGSSRKMGDLHEQALGMARHFGSQVSGGVEPDAPRYTRVRKLSRP